MKISVIIPCYNVEHYIRQCIASISLSSDVEYEVIAIDDGSTDQTLMVLKDIASQNKRLRVFEQNNEGVSVARNLGLEKATGEYIMFVDGDDWLAPHSIDYLLSEVQDDDILCFSYFRDYQNISYPKDLKISGVFSADYFQRLLFGLLDSEIERFDSIDALVPCWGKIYKKSVIGDCVFKDIREIGTWEDGIFNIEVAENAQKIRILNVPYYHYRKNNEFAITKVHKKNLSGKWQVKYQWLQDFILHKNKCTDFNEALKNRISITFLGLLLNEFSANVNIIEKYKAIRCLLDHSFYKNELSKFNIKKLPFLWKCFYFCVKKRLTLLVFVFLNAIAFFINKNNQ